MRTSRVKYIISRFKDEKGMALPFVATMLVVLLGVAAFAVDLGWLYLNGTRLQRAADSSALAGVVYLPGDTTGAADQAVNGANANGWDIGTVNGNPVGGGGPDELTWQSLADNKLEVTLQASVPSFFVKVLGIDSFSLTRTATAEYVKPVPLGSPANCFGIGGSVSSSGLSGGASTALSVCSGYTQNFWAGINGRRTAKEHGDPFGVACITASSSSCNGTNSDYRPNYFFGVEVPAGKTYLDVYIYDLGFYDRSGFAEAGDEQSLSNSASGGTHTTFSLFDPDQSPVIPSDNNDVSPCSVGGPNPHTVNSGSSSSTYKNRWLRICRVSNPEEGIYVLKIANNGNIGGSNHYAILADTNNVASNFPRVYGINDMSIFTNAPSGSATIYLADVDPVHAGKTLELEFFDPGEGAGNADMTVEPPPGVGPISCVWTATNGQSGNTCTLNTTISGTAQFNSEWITMQIDIPSDYTCSTDCYWKMDADLNVSHDRTTWTARVIGNPVRLVPNP